MVDVGGSVGAAVFCDNAAVVVVVVVVGGVWCWPLWSCGEVPARGGC